jgi:uncharacterized membrane protein YbhN (UPF0104 family)
MSRKRVVRSLAITLLATAAVAYVVARNAHDVQEALGEVSLGAALALTGLHLLALLLRAESWGLCLRAAGTPVPRADLHSTSALTFLANTAVPMYVGLWVRVGLLKRLMPAHAPTIGQMITADAILLLIEAVITVLLVLIAAATLDLSWWWIVSVVGITALAVAGALWLRKRFAHRPFAQTFDVLDHPWDRVWLTMMLAVVLIVQPIRFWISLKAVGFDPTLFEALATFLVTNVLNALPVGPGPASVGATAAIFGREGIGAATASGLVLAGTAFVAAALYSAAACVGLVPRLLGPGEENVELELAPAGDPPSRQGAPDSEAAGDGDRVEAPARRSIPSTGTGRSRPK